MKLLDTSQERAVLSTYYHTWNGYKYGGFSVNSNGSVSWKTVPEDYGEDLDVAITEGSDADKRICGPI